MDQKQGRAPSPGTRLRALRESLGVRPAELARHLGYHPSYIRQLEGQGAATEATYRRAVLALFHITTARYLDIRAETNRLHIAPDAPELTSYEDEGA